MRAAGGRAGIPPASIQATVSARPLRGFTTALGFPHPRLRRSRLDRLGRGWSLSGSSFVRGPASFWSAFVAARTFAEAVRFAALAIARLKSLNICTLSGGRDQHPPLGACRGSPGALRRAVRAVSACWLVTYPLAGHLGEAAGLPGHLPDAGGAGLAPRSSRRCRSGPHPIRKRSTIRIPTWLPMIRIFATRRPTDAAITPTPLSSTIGMRSGRGLRRRTGLSRNTQRQSPSIAASPAEHHHDLVDPLALLVLVEPLSIACSTRCPT